MQLRRVFLMIFALAWLCPLWATEASSPVSELPRLKSVSQYGITWTFEQPAPVGQFINGDFYVVGPVTIANVGPRPLVGSEVPLTEEIGRAHV